MKSQCLFLCLCYFVIGSYANLGIDKCEVSDKDCLVKSSQKFLPVLVAGLPEYGVPTLDPLKLKQIKLEESGLKIVFDDVTVTGSSKCKVLKVERSSREHLLFEVECPIKAAGTYTASGKLLVAPIEGHGPFEVETNKAFISVKAVLETVDGDDGEKHWRIVKAEYEYEIIEKAKLIFENLFNGDKEKAAPILAIFDREWKSLLHTMGKPIINEVIETVINYFKIFISKVPTSELEK